MDPSRRIPGTEQAILDSGLRALVTPVPSTRAVSVTFFIGVGSRYEPDELAGASHMLEHMLFKGSEKRPTAREIALAIEGVGGTLNASTGKEYTMLYAKVPHQQLDLALDVLGDMLRRSLFDATELEKEKRVIVEEIRMNLDNPFDWAHQLLDEEVWPGHSLGRDIAGTTESVLAMPRDRLVDYWRAHYGAPRVVLSMAGRLEAGPALKEAERLLQPWGQGSAEQFGRFDLRQRRPRARVGRRKTEQAYVVLAALGLHRGHPERFALQLLNTVLGEGMSSRLFQRVREEQGLAYSVDSWVRLLADTGELGVSAGVDAERLEPALDAILAELRRIADEPVPEAELASAREQVKGRLQLQIEDSLSIAGWYGQQEVLNQPILTVDNVLVELDRVSAQDVQRVAQAVLQPSHMSAVVVGKFRTDLARTVRDKLAVLHGNSGPHQAGVRGKPQG